MNNFYEMDLLFNFINIVMMIYFFNKIMPSKNKKYTRLYTILIIIFYFFIPSTKQNSILYKLKDGKIVLFVLGYYSLVLLYPLLFREGRLSEKFFLSSFYISINLVCSFTIFILTSNILNLPLIHTIIYFSYNKCFSILFNKSIQFILVYIFLNNINFINFIKYIKDKILYVGGIVLILSQLLILVLEINSIKKIYIANREMVFIVSILCIIQILSVYVLNILSKEIEEKFILKINLDRKVHDEEVIDMYKQMMGWKHDLKNHISMITGLLEIGTKEEALSYINEINSNISKLDKNIYTNNIAINSIIASKMKIIEEKNININLELSINAEIKISNIDICIILGNLLDNSIEAGSTISEYRFINLKIVSEHSRLVIKISNNTNGIVNEVNGRFLTTKNNDISGVGLIQIDNIVKKYDGYINRKHENNIFTTYMMIQYKD